VSGFVSLVGAGPGDPGLLTIAGKERLQQAEVVVYDRLANPALLDHAPATAERIFAGKTPEHKALTQAQINALLVEKGRQGLRVVRLKGGDPFVFGRGGEEALALVEAGVPFEVVPGVTSAVAAPAYAGVPVTHRGLASSFAVVTGHEDDDKLDGSVDWRRLATAVDTIVVLMGGAALPAVSKALIEGGRDPSTPAVSIQWGTTERQRSVRAPLSEIAAAVQEAGLGTPLMTVVGEVGSLQDQIGWFEHRPLSGKRVLVTRTRQQASTLAELLRREGAVPIELATLELVPVANDEELEAMTRDLEAGAYAWSVFTSTNAVDAVFAYFDRTGRDARAFGSSKIAALGTATANALQTRGIRADLAAADFSSNGVVEAMQDIDLTGRRVLLPRAAGGNPALVGGLKDRGARVDEVILYESQPPKEPDETILERIRWGEIGVATFASSSSVRNLATLLDGDLSGLYGATIACIGPMTAATADEYGLEVDIQPAQHTVPALVEAIKAHFQNQ
jgi:uroporphyrinogen III methyltransferase/synthase